MDRRRGIPDYSWQPVGSSVCSRRRRPLARRTVPAHCAGDVQLTAGVGNHQPRILTSWAAPSLETGRRSTATVRRPGGSGMASDERPRSRGSRTRKRVATCNAPLTPSATPRWDESAASAARTVTSSSGPVSRGERSRYRASARCSCSIRTGSSTDMSATMSSVTCTFAPTYAAASGRASRPAPPVRTIPESTARETVRTSSGVRDT